MNSLPGEMTALTSLVQHVALNESGWWQRAMERIVLAYAYSVGPNPIDDLRDLVIRMCGMPPNSERVSSTIDTLLASGAIVELNGFLRPSEETLEELSQLEAATQCSENRVRSRFDEMAHERGLSDRSDELWSIMETEVVLPIIRQMGARMYGLVTTPTTGTSDPLEFKIADLLSQHGSSVRSLLTDFLDPHSQDIRGFVLRRLNAQYAVDAAALPEDALVRISHLNEKTGRIDVFLDTNFVFSVLGLHENPGDDVASELLNLVRELEGRVHLRLYVLPDTIDEARRVLREVLFSLEEFSGQPNLAEAAIQSGSAGLSGRYFQEARRSPTQLTPGQFFGPYESDLLRMLRGKSVELYNADLAPLHTAQDVIDDLLDQEEYQRNNRSRGPKPYAANLHDMVLWHFAKSKRDTHVESPLDIRAWVVTLDYGLIGFDRHKHRVSSKSRRTFEPPICLDPSSLIQLFQFWIPSSTELGEALVGSVRQPLLFLNFDAESERITLRILAQLSRLEGSEDINAEVASEILTSAALRDRLSSTSGDSSRDEKIVREEMTQIVQVLGDEVTELRRSQESSTTRIAQLEKQLQATEASTELEEEKAARIRAEEAHASEAVSRLDLKAKHEELLDRTKSMEARLDKLDDTNKDLQQEVTTQQAFVRRANRWRVGTVASLAVVLALCSLLASGLVLDELFQPSLAWLAGGSAATLSLLFGVDLSTRGTGLEESPWVMRLRLLTRWWWTFLGAILASVVAGWILQT